MQKLLSTNLLAITEAELASVELKLAQAHSSYMESGCKESTEF